MRWPPEPGAGLARAAVLLHGPEPYNTPENGRTSGEDGTWMRRLASPRPQYSCSMCSSATPSFHGSRSTLMAACSSAKAMSSDGLTGHMTSADAGRHTVCARCAASASCCRLSAGVLPVCVAQCRAVMYTQDSSASDASVAILHSAAAVSCDMLAGGHVPQGVHLAAETRQVCKPGGRQAARPPTSACS